MLARANHNRDPFRNELLAELLPRQALLAFLNAATAFLFTTSMAGAAPLPVFAAWFGYMALPRVVRVQNPT